MRDARGARAALRTASPRHLCGESQASSPCDGILGAFPLVLAGTHRGVPASPRDAGAASAGPERPRSALTRACQVDLKAAVVAGNHHALTDPVGLALQGGLPVGSLSGPSGRGVPQYRAVGDAVLVVLERRLVVVRAEMRAPGGGAARGADEGGGGGSSGGGGGGGDADVVSFRALAADWTGRSSLGWICSGGVRGYIAEAQYQGELRAATDAAAAADGTGAWARRPRATDAAVFEEGVSFAAVLRLRSVTCRDGQPPCYANVSAPPRRPSRELCREEVGRSCMRPPPLRRSCSPR